MATENPVKQVLVTSGNQALLAAGSRPDALAVGQLGIFNYHTGLSVDGSVAADTKDIFLAVGIDPDSVGSLQDIMRSAGEVLQVRNAKSLTFKGYLAALPKIVDVTVNTPKCETDYALKVEFRNGEVYAIHGYNQFTKTWAFRTGCCADECEPCGSGDCNELSKGLVDQINVDPDGLVTAQYFNNIITATVTAGASASANITITIGTTVYTIAVTNGQTAAQVAATIVAGINGTANTPYKAANTGAALSIYPVKTLNTPTGTFALTNANGTGVTVGSIVASAKAVVTTANRDAFVTANPGVCLGIRLTSVPVGTYKNTEINLKYHKVRVTDMIVSTPIGEDCAAFGDIVTVQELQQADGLGYDLRQEEYIAGGWNGKPGPYRVSDTVPGIRDGGGVYFTSNSGTYNVFRLTYDQFSVGGWLEYLNNLETVIAIPCADATTLTSIGTMFDLIFTQFGGMAGDIAANGDCTNAATSALTPATDGIESLS